MRSRSLSSWACIAGAAILLLLSGCVMGMERAGQFDPGRTFKTVQVLPNYGGNPDCSSEFCAVLFTGGNAGLYVPRVETRGPAAPRNYNLSGLWAYQVSDGSLLFAAPGSRPTEYASETGAIRIEFQALIGPEQDRRETGGGTRGP
ncbi:MAG: hypothetical protein C4576_05395 [Desulfobacteraceae bacterium]|nr:MAG: hypothetical protein C4576_05395 [Desulfobacteraceae bacterium]